MRLNMSRVDSQKVLGTTVQLEKVPLPKRGTDLAAGYDLYTPVKVSIRPAEQMLVPLGVTWDPPQWKLDFQVSETTISFGGFLAKIWDRSGLAVKKRFNTRAGVIDQDYKDPWGLVCVNESQEVVTFGVGDRIAQFVLLPFLVAEDLEDAAETRSGGFGSTGN
jgi:dUTP pyrophosphatase